MSIQHRNNIEKKRGKTHRYYIDFESRINIELSTSNQCQCFDMDSLFIIDEISTNFRYVILMLNLWQIEEDVSIGIT